MRRDVRDASAADALSAGVARHEILFLSDRIDELHRADASVVANLMIGIAEVVAESDGLVRVVYERHFQRNRAAAAALELRHIYARSWLLAVGRGDAGGGRRGRRRSCGRCRR